MKKLVLGLLIFMSALAAKAQGYQSIFGDSTTQWNIANFLPDATFTIDYSIGDTVIINGIAYRKVLNYGNNVSEFSIREDTLTGKAWVYNTISNSEHLVYDISLNVGDSLLTSLPFWFGLSDYAIVESVNYINNRKHIRFNKFLSWHWQDIKPFEIIEGVGPNTGMFGHWDFTKLVCTRKDGNLVYADSAMFTNGSCNYIQVGLEDMNRQSSLNIYPNPASDQITFALANQTQEPVRVVIFDALGRTVHEETTTAENPQLAISNWVQGMYFYRILSGEKQLASGRFVIGR